MDSSVEEIPPIAFRWIGSLAKVEIKSGVQTIGVGAFSGCDNLIEVIIPSTVVQIEYCAFYQCEDLQKVVLSMGLTQIGHHAFAGCSTLTEIIIPSTVVEIDSCAFGDCSSLSNTIDLPMGLQRIAGGAFANCHNFVNLSIPSTVTDFGWDVFEECDNLQSIDIKGPLAGTRDEPIENNAPVRTLPARACGSMENPIYFSDSDSSPGAKKPFQMPQWNPKTRPFWRPNARPCFEWDSSDDEQVDERFQVRGGSLPLAIRLSTQYPTKTPNITMSFLVSQYFFHRITVLDLLEPVWRFDDQKQQCKENEEKKLEEIKSAFVEHLRLLVEWRVCSGNFMAITNRKRKAED